MTGSSKSPERVPYEDPTPSTITMRGRAQAAREATRRALDEQMREHEVPEQPPIEWKLPDGTPINIPTVLHEFALAVGHQLSAMKAEVGGLYEAIGENTDETKKIAADTAEIVKVAKSIKATVDVASWVGKVAKSVFWVVITVAVAGALLYGTLADRFHHPAAQPVAPAK